MNIFTYFSISTLFAVASAQLSGTVGPTTTAADKKAVAYCDVTSYGAVASVDDDLSGPLTDAIEACKDGGLSKFKSIPNKSYRGRITLVLTSD